MLVLSRKHNETLHIGDDIVITIVRVRGESVRLGIQAPQSVHILRSELLGTPSKQTTAPEQNPSQPQSALNSDQQSGKTQAVEGPANSQASGPGPLAKFLKAFPKLQLATAS